MSIIKNKVKKIKAILGLENSCKKFFIKWDEPIDEKMESYFIQKKTREIKRALADHQ